VQVGLFDMQMTLLSVQAATNSSDEKAFTEALAMPYEKRLAFDKGLEAEPVPMSKSEQIRREMGVA
jgi:hypothetical protein